MGLSHIFFTGSGKVGRLTTSDADLNVGSPVEGIEAASAKLDSESYVEFNVVGKGSTARTDYSQLTSHGAIELDNANVEVVVRPPSEGASCPVLVPGQTYTFVSTTGSLSGSFANAPEHGAEMPIRFANACTPKSQTIRIAYHESGGTQTVTGTVEEAAATKKQEEEAAAKKKREEEAAAKRTQEEEAAAKSGWKNQSQRMRKKQQPEEARRSGSGRGMRAARSSGRKKNLPPPVPDAKLASTALEASLSGTVSIKISCPAGESSCSGTVTLRTLGARHRQRRQLREGEGDGPDSRERLVHRRRRPGQDGDAASVEPRRARCSRVRTCCTCERRSSLTTPRARRTPPRRS